MKDGDEGTPAFASALARYLRQREELGSRSLFLDGGAPPELLEELSRLRDLPSRGPSQGRASGPIRAEARGKGPQAAGTPSAMAAPRASRQIEEAAGADDRSLPGTLEALEAVCSECRLCGLAETRRNVVFADGNPGARVMVVGEAPGANEDATGLPFVGAAGKLLDLLLLSVGLSREDSVYICNVIKCRPPGNRNPTTAEISTCSPYLLGQIDLVRPEVILAVGTFSGRLLTGQEATLGELRGQVHRYHGTPLVVTYHPAALLRNPGWTRSTWEDLQLLRRVMAGEDQAT